jgi:hypothetical protein
MSRTTPTMVVSDAGCAMSEVRTGAHSDAARTIGTDRKRSSIPACWSRNSRKALDTTPDAAALRRAVSLPQWLHDDDAGSGRAVVFEVEDNENRSGDAPDPPETEGHLLQDPAVLQPGIALLGASTEVSVDEVELPLVLEQFTLLEGLVRTGEAIAFSSVAQIGKTLWARAVKSSSAAGRRRSSRPQAASTPRVPRAR